MILVTGATGTNGSLVLRQLLELGLSVRAVTRDPARAAQATTAGNGDVGSVGSVEWVTADFAQPASLDAALAGVEQVFFVPPFSPDHVAHAEVFIKAAKAHEVRQVVKLSAFGAGPEVPVSLGRWHAHSDELLVGSGLGYTILRPNSFMQNLLSVAPYIAAKGLFQQPADDARISHIDATDIASVAVCALTQEGHLGKSYDLTGPAALSFVEIADIFTAVTGSPVTYVPVAPEFFAVGCREAGMPPWAVEALLELYAIYRAGWAAGVTTTVTDIIGRPARTFTDFAQTHRQQFLRT